MLIRRETDRDVPAVRAVVAAAFADAAAPGVEPVEVRLVDDLRQTDEWLPPLSLVAVTDTELVGYVVCTRAWVGDRDVLGLGPVAVAPGRQRSGVGTALMHAVLGAADALGESLVVLLGHTDYYPRFGFLPAAELGIVAPAESWGPHFQARTLTAYDGSIRGAFRYAGPFNDL